MVLVIRQGHTELFPTGGVEQRVGGAPAVIEGGHLMRAVVLEEAQGVSRHLGRLRHALLSAVSMNLWGQGGRQRRGVEHSAPMCLQGGIVVAKGRAVGNSARSGGTSSSLDQGVGGRLLIRAPSSAVLG